MKIVEYVKEHKVEIATYAGVVIAISGAAGLLITMHGQRNATKCISELLFGEQVNFNKLDGITYTKGIIMDQGRKVLAECYDNNPDVYKKVYVLVVGQK
jgi:hypothetical protein